MVSTLRFLVPISGGHDYVSSQNHFQPTAIVRATEHDNTTLGATRITSVLVLEGFGDLGGRDSSAGHLLLSVSTEPQGENTSSRRWRLGGAAR
jgi:hypothetical protein